MVTLQSKREQRTTGRPRPAQRAPKPSGPLGTLSLGAGRLPGQGAASRLYEVKDAYLRPFAILAVPSRGQYTVVLEAVRDFRRDVTVGEIAQWTSLWGPWIDSAGTSLGVVAASVTLEVFDMGAESGLPPIRSTDDPARVMADRLDYVGRLRARVALTVGSGRRGKSGLPDMATDLGRRLPALSAQFQLLGQAPARPVAGHELAEIVRTAYDPSVWGFIEQAREQGGTGMSWSQAGPVDSEEEWDSYRHDGVHSVTWAMSESAGEEAFQGTLAGLLKAMNDGVHRRATLLFGPPRPEITAATDPVKPFRSRNKGKSADAEPAPAANPWLPERKLARYGMLVTATAGGEGALSRSARALDGLPAYARVSLRKVYGSQAAAFVAGLPLGTDTPDGLAMPVAARWPVRHRQGGRKRR
ncbi:SCO6880 family protein [Yinghuangia sp. YIM S09857]|uniref:SCO6880 family protein n=1 Tax=Yinghuangia sp. YIM S09857 TaxID=3436929 RepID=UPI003F52C0DF